MLTSDITTSIVSGIAELVLVAVCAWRGGARLRPGGLPTGTGRMVLVAIVAIGVVAAIVAAITVSALFAACLGLSLRADGETLPLTTLILVNWAATTAGSIAPTPGGLGVAEAGLVAGLTAAGVPTDVAVATALRHRLLTFWLPPIPGWFALRTLDDDGH